MDVQQMSSKPYGEGETLAPQVVLAAWLVPVFPAIFVCARFYTTRRILKSKPKEDWFILVALISSILFSVSVTIQAQYGLGRHMGDVPDPKHTYTKYLLVSAFGVTSTYPIANFFTKLSILSFYLRFTTSRCFTYAVYSTIALVFVFNFVGATGVLYWCKPIKVFWTHWNKDQCLDNNIWYASLLGINVVVDIIILLMPICIIRPLRVEFAQKVAIGAILGTGGFVLGVSLFRWICEDLVIEDKDYTWRLAIHYIWGNTELNVAIICACMPCLKPLLVRLFPRARWLRAVPQPRDLDTISLSALTDRDTSTDIAQRRIDWAALRASHGVKTDTEVASTDLTSTEERDYGVVDPERGRTEDQRSGQAPGNSSGNNV
ncbi:hypothetical protein B0H65DRAFT_300185 [Neurospora tetraspora]|uniref:Rhodopsin domain-containing protein n=1 Tax=Neurospora tetraspora TaxID=94610 RepID=A0AAE0MQ63_9PEZI|nr:hypothetical protein B0H65DRAFT_300185 [Neurospora tetraspora]